jgi:hypothetical protein
MTGRIPNGRRRLKKADVLDVIDVGGRRVTVVTTEQSLLTSAWTADVRMLEAAIGRFASEQPLANDCQVVMFEIAGDNDLHVNVVHELPHTARVDGWSGPGRLPAGSVYNRRFGNTPPGQIIRHIREMVFA